MKTPLLILVTLTTAALAQDTWEAVPALKAADILKPEILSGPSHRVLDNVTTFQGRNHYTIETPWGYFSAEGDAMLMARIAEARALAEMQNVSRTEAYKEGVKTAAKAPLNTVRGLVDDPAETVKGTAKGLWKFAGRAGASVTGAAKARERGQGGDKAAKQLLGMSKAKRELALQLGADPYSSNEIFQEQLESIAWVKTAGAATFQLATMPIGGGAGLALTATEMSNTFQQSLRDLSPVDLRLANKKALTAMGVDAKVADRFLANPAFSPTNQTAFVTALRALAGVKNRGAFVQLAADIATVEADALFCSGTAQLFAALHSGPDKIAAIATLGGFPVAIAADGRLVIALQWDTAFWSERAEQFIERATAAKLGQTGPPVIALTGAATPRMKAELEKRKIGILTNALGGPQK